MLQTVATLLQVAMCWDAPCDMVIKATLQTAPKIRPSLGPVLLQAIGYLEMSNAALAAALRREADKVPGLSLEMPDTAAAPTSLFQHATDQIGLLISDPRHRKIAQAFVGALEPTGWLGMKVEEVAASVGVDVATAQTTLGDLQQIEPAGLFATCLADCLRLQVAERDLLTPAVDAVLTHLDMMTMDGPGGIAQATDLEEHEVVAVLAVLRQCDPKPGLQFAGPELAQARPHDLELGIDGKVRFNPDSLPQLYVDDAAPARAHRIATLLDHRNQLVLDVANEIVKRQRDWIDGSHDVLQPLRRIDVARKSGVHECTVSRIAAAMSVKTQRGVHGLARLFARPLAGSVQSHDALRQRITELIAKEDRKRPLSDAMIAKRLMSQGFSVARRGIARHRAKAGIAAAPARRSRA